MKIQFTPTFNASNQGKINFLLKPWFMGILLFINPCISPAQETQNRTYVYGTVLESVKQIRDNASILQMREIGEQIIVKSQDNLRNNNQLIKPLESGKPIENINLNPLPTQIPDIRDSNNVRFAYCNFTDDNKNIDEVAFFLIGAGANGRFDSSQNCTDLKSQIQSLPVYENEKNLKNKTDDIYLIYTYRDLNFSGFANTDFGRSVKKYSQLPKTSDEGVRIDQIRLVEENNQFFIAKKDSNQLFTWKPVSGKWSENSPPSKESDLIDLNLNSGSLGLGLRQDKYQQDLPEKKLAILNIGNMLDITKYAAGIAFQKNNGTNFAYIGMALDPNNQKFEIKNIINQDQPNILFFDADGNITIGHHSSKTTNFNNKNTFNENVTFKNTVDLTSTLTVNGTSTFKSNVTIGELSKAANLEVYGESTFNNTVNIKGTTTLNNLTVNETSTFNKLASFNENVKIAKSLTVTDSSTFNSNLDVKNRLNSGELHVSGITNLDNKLTVAKNGIEISGPTFFNNGIIVKQEPSNFLNGLEVSGKSALGGNLEISGSGKFSQLNVINGITSGTLLINGTSTLRDTLNITFGGLEVYGEANFNSSIRVLDRAVFTNGLYVAGPAIFKNFLTVNSITQLNNALKVGANANFNAVTTANHLNTNILTVNRNSLFGDAITIEKNGLTVYGTSRFNSNLSIQGYLETDGNLSAGNIIGDGEALTNLNATNLTGTLAIEKGGTGISNLPLLNQILVGNSSGNSYSLKTLGNSSDILLNSNSTNLSFDLTNTIPNPGTYGSSFQIPFFTVDSKGRITSINQINSNILPLSLKFYGQHLGKNYLLSSNFFPNNAAMDVILNLNNIPYLSSINQDLSSTGNPRFTNVFASQFFGYLSGTADVTKQLNKRLGIRLNGFGNEYTLDNSSPDTLVYNLNLGRILNYSQVNGTTGSAYYEPRTCGGGFIREDIDETTGITTPIYADTYRCDIYYPGGSGGYASFNNAGTFVNTNTAPTNPSTPSIYTPTISLQSPLFSANVNLPLNGTNQTIDIQPASGFNHILNLDQGVNTNNQLKFNSLTIQNSNNNIKNETIRLSNGNIEARFLDVLNQANINNRLLIQNSGASNTTDGNIEISASNAKISIGSVPWGQSYLNPSITLEGQTGTITSKKLIASEDIYTPKLIKAGASNFLVNLDGSTGKIDTRILTVQNDLSSPLVNINNQIKIGPNSSFPSIILDGITGTTTTQNLVITGTFSINELNIGTAENLIQLNGFNGRIAAKNAEIREQLSILKNLRIEQSLQVGDFIQANAEDGSISARSVNSIKSISVGTGANLIKLDHTTGQISGNNLNITESITVGPQGEISLNGITGEIKAKSIKTTGNIILSNNSIVLNATDGNILANSINASKLKVGQQNTNEGVFFNYILANGATGTIYLKEQNLRSDARLKENILPVDKASLLKRLQSLNLYAYNFINDPTADRHLGLLAQEVMPLFPEAVSMHTNGTLKDYYAVNYDILSAAAAVGLGELSRKLGEWRLHLKTPESLSTSLPNFVVKNLTTQTLETQKLKAKLIESEQGLSEELETKNFTAVNSRAKNIQSDTLNSGYTEGFSGLGGSLLLFTAANDGQYLVNVSANDGSYATANVFVAGGQVHIIPLASVNIHIESLSGNVHAIAAGKILKASWIRMG